jgi:hypothetical protein
MIRVFAALSRLEGVDKQYFHDHWRHPHATYGVQIPAGRSYVQAHQVHSDSLGDDQAQYEAISVIEFDSLAEAGWLAFDRQYYEWILPDEPLFMDKSKARTLVTEEEVLVPRLRRQDGASVADAAWYHLDRPVAYQLLQFVRPGGDPDWARDDDVELGHRLRALRHARNRPVAAVHGDQPPFIGARQLWWPTRTDFETAVAADPEAFTTLLGRGGDVLSVLVQSERLVN